MNAAMDEVFLDIETVPAQNERIVEALQGELNAAMFEELGAVKAPSNYKDEAKIEEYIAARRHEISDSYKLKAEEKMHATGLDGAYGEVWCVGVAVNDDEPEVFHRGGDMTPDAERDVLRRFFDAVGQRTKLANIKRVIGHNVVAFDLRFIYQRSMVLGIRPPAWLPKDVKPWEQERVFDTMVAWAGPRDRVSLSKLCRAFGIEDDDTITGKDVWSHIKEGDYTTPAIHCSYDIDKTRRIYRRMTFTS